MKVTVACSVTVDIEVSTQEEEAIQNENFETIEVVRNRAKDMADKVFESNFGEYIVVAADVEGLVE